MLRALINSQVWLSRKFDEWLPALYRIDGNRDFVDSLVPDYLQADLTIVDVGGGKNPYLSPAKKSRLKAHVIGLDIDQTELNQAPKGAYDEIVCADISKYRGKRQADMVICQAVLEHVRDVESAFTAIASCLKPGGQALLFVPSRNAVFARLNILLPQNIKKALLHWIFPKTRRDQGFPSFYDHCTPSDFKRMAASNDLALVEARYFYKSSYFSFLFPLYLLWRLWVILFRAIRGEQAAETFSMVLRREGSVT
jgi:2-polyprenyl-6-hydroxyphenyl methylase/3-demethylubiquinone-9 3-methyltransferase